METRKITKYHIAVVILILIIILTIVWATISIINIKSNENGDIIKETVEQTEDIEEIVDYEEPDLTLEEYQIKLYEAEALNIGRYSTEELNKILADNIKTDDNVELSFIKNNSYSTIGFKKSEFNDFMSVWYPDNACVIIMCKADINTVSPMTEWLREFSEQKKKEMIDDTKKAIYIYYEDKSYNGYRIIAMCDNAQTVVDKIIQYMQQEDAKSIDLFKSKYTLTEHGAYEKDKEHNNEQ